MNDASAGESRDDSSPETKSREIVLPGELLAEGKYRAGTGTYKEKDKIFSAQLGVKNIKSNFVNVVPLAGQYVPKVGDQVIGVVQDVNPSSWLVEINSPYPAPMHISEAPWKVDFGDTARYLSVGDVILAKVFMVDEMKRVQVSMREHGLRKLHGGQIVEVSYSKVPRVIGKNGSMIQMIKGHTGCRIIVGQNGRIWLDGEMDGIALAVRAIRIIEEQAQAMGLTDRVREFLEGAQVNKKG